jgi:hypothetical protein
MAKQNNEWTPGPWTWEYHPDFLDKVMALSAGKTDVFICTGTRDASFGIVSEANARLFAATSDLLAVCEEIAHFLPYYTFFANAPVGSVAVEIPGILRAAIAKARGEVSE